MKKFKIKSVGIFAHETRTYASPIHIDYVYTNINSMNEDLTAGLLGNSNTELVTYVDYLDTVDRQLSFHARRLGREKINYLLVDASCDFEKYRDVLEGMVDMGLVENIGVAINDKIEIDRLEEIKKVVDFGYISMEVSPDNFQKKVIDWCEDKNICIFGTNPLGNNTEENTKIYSLPYLLNFASLYSDIVFVSLEPTYINYLGSNIDKEVDESIYNIKEIERKAKEVKTKVIPFLKLLDGKLLLPTYDNLLYKEVEIGKSFSSTCLIDCPDENLEEIKNLFNSRYIPEDKKGGSTLSYFLPTVLRYLETNMSDYSNKYFLIGPEVLIIDLYRESRFRLFKKNIKESRITYVIHVTPENEIMLGDLTQEFKNNNN